MKQLLEENDTLTQIVYDAGRIPTAHPDDGISPIYKTELSSKNPVNKK